MEKLTLQARIHGFLKRLMEKRSLLTVHVDGQATDYNSAIIKVADDQSYFLLDELNPEDGHTLLKQKGQCHIKGHVDGVSLSFDAPIDHFGEDKGIPYYRILMPSSINYLQRRSAHRVSFSAANPVPVSLTAQNKQTVNGHMSDLSTGGLRIKFDNDIDAAIENGDILRCQFTVEGTTFSTEVIVRIARLKDDGFKKPFLGAQFHQLVPAQERQLQRLIMGLERAARQRQ